MNFTLIASSAGLAVSMFVLGMFWQRVMTANKKMPVGGINTEFWKGGQVPPRRPDLKAEGDEVLLPAMTARDACRRAFTDDAYLRQRVLKGEYDIFGANKVTLRADFQVKCSLDLMKEVAIEVTTEELATLKAAQ